VDNSSHDSAAFTSIAPYYDLLMRDVPYRAWVRYIEQLLRVRGTKPRRVLDLACGTGNVAELLAQAGHEVVGVDVSGPMIAQAIAKAERKRLPITYHRQDAACMRIPGPPFDLCVSLFDSVNYITDPADVQRAFHRVAEHLRPGGLFIFDINSVFALENGFFDQEHTDPRDRLRYVWRSQYDPRSRLCRVHMRFWWRDARGREREFAETHVQFAYTVEELIAMLEAAGFVAIQTYHAYTLVPVRPSSDRIFFVAEKAGSAVE